MKKVLLLTMALSLCASIAMADHIGLYNEVTGLNCFRSAAWGQCGLSNNVYVIHKFNGGGATSSEFKVNNLSGAPFTSRTLGNAAFLDIGAPESGVSVSYNSCINGDIYVMRLRYADDDCIGLAPIPCGRMDIVADPSAVPPFLGTVDCSGMPKPATGGSFYWGSGCGSCNEPTATQSATWGSIKALYR